jgi:hypothetical protein
MFAKPRRLAWGAAALGPIVSVGLPAAAQAGTAPAPAPKDHCIVNALSAKQVAAGVKSVVVCYATKQEAEAAVSGAGGPVTNAFGSGFAMATFYQSRSMDPSRTVTAYGSACTDYLYYTPDSWLDYMAAWAPRGCTSAKHFTGANFTGQMLYTSSTPYAFSSPFLRNIRSVKFG